MSTVVGTVPTEQRDIARRVTHSVVFQIVAKGAHVVFNVVSSLAIIRYLAPATFGDYVLVGSLVTLFGLLTDFGIDKFAIREISLDERAESEITGTVVVMRLAFSGRSPSCSYRPRSSRSTAARRCTSPRRLRQVCS